MRALAVRSLFTRVIEGPSSKGQRSWSKRSRVMIQAFWLSSLMRQHKFSAQKLDATRTSYSSAPLFHCSFPFPSVMACGRHCAIRASVRRRKRHVSHFPAHSHFSTFCVLLPKAAFSSPSSSGRFTRTAARLRRTVRPCTLQLRAFLRHSARPFPAVHVGGREASGSPSGTENLNFKRNSALTSAGGGAAAILPSRGQARN